MMVNQRIRVITIVICLIALLMPLYIALAASLFNQTYLPIINKQPSTPTSQPPVLFPNGDFEQGPVIWTQYSSHGWKLIYPQQELPQGVSPYDGSWVAWLGGDYSETSFIEQQIFVSSFLPYMSYWYWVVPSVSDGCGNSYGLVLVNGEEVQGYDLCYDTGGWIQGVIDLSNHSNNWVVIQIIALCINSNSDLFVDHVAFQPNQNVANHPIEARATIDANTPWKDILGK